MGDYLIYLLYDEGRIQMDSDLPFFEACYRADVYKRHDKKASFWVVKSDDEYLENVLYVGQE